MTSVTESEKSLLQRHEPMTRLSPDVLQGRLSLSLLDLPEERGVTSRLSRIRLQQIKERRYTEGELQFLFLATGSLPHYLEDLRNYNDGRPHAPLRYDKLLPLTMSSQEREIRKQKIISNRNTEEEQLIKFLQTQEISRTVESKEDLFAMKDAIFIAQDVSEETDEDLTHEYESLTISSSTSYREPQ